MPGTSFVPSIIIDGKGQTEQIFIFYATHCAFFPLLSELAEVHGNRTHHGHLCPSLDLKSRRPTRTCPLPNYNLRDFLFKVKVVEFIIIHK